MPQPALTVFLIIAAIAIVVVLIAVIVIALRAQRRRKLAQTLEKRRDDEVQYAFIVNPSKPQAEARRLHIQRFCEAKGLNRIRFYDTQLDKDGRVCALEALEDGADVVIAVGGDGTVRTVASAVSGTGHALGIIPIGTGNLFARNMGVPVDDIDAALTVATHLSWRAPGASVAWHKGTNATMLATAATLGIEPIVKLRVASKWQ